MKNKWCEHCDLSDPRYKGGVMTYPNYHYRGIDCMDMFCPVCGAPRPEELNLTEKFRAWGKAYATSPIDISGRGYWESLADIATEHFKNGGK